LRYDHGHLTADQVGRQLRQPIVTTRRLAIFDGYVPAFDVVSLGETAAERIHEMRGFNCRRENPDHRHRRLLRASRERPRGCRAAEQRDEGAPSHFISLTVLSWDQLSCEPQ